MQDSASQLGAAPLAALLRKRCAAAAHNAAPQQPAEGASSALSVEAAFVDAALAVLALSDRPCQRDAALQVCVFFSVAVTPFSVGFGV
jgi:hypothetical protein